MRHSISIKSASKRVPNKQFNEALKYSENDYACIHGGKDFKTRAQ